MKKILDNFAYFLCIWVALMVILTAAKFLPGQVAGDIGFFNRAGNSFFWDVNGDGVYDTVIGDSNYNLLINVGDGNEIQTDPGDDVNLDDWTFFLDSAENTIEMNNTGEGERASALGTNLWIHNENDSATWGSYSIRGLSVYAADTTSTGGNPENNRIKGTESAAGWAGTAEGLNYDHDPAGIVGTAFFAGAHGTPSDFSDAIGFGVLGVGTEAFTGSPSGYPSFVGVANEFENVGTSGTFYIGGAFSDGDIETFLGTLAGGYGAGVDGRFWWVSPDGTKSLLLDNSGATPTGFSFAPGTITVQEADATVSASATTIDFGAGFDVTDSPAGEANIVLDLTEDKVVLTAAAEVTGLLPDANIVSTIARDSELHSAVTVSGTPDYITLSGQDIVRAQVDMTADITGAAPDANVADTITLDAGSIGDASSTSASSIIMRLTGSAGAGTDNLAVGDPDVDNLGQHIDIESGGHIRGDGELGHTGDEWDTVWANTIDDSDGVVVIAASDYTQIDSYALTHDDFWSPVINLAQPTLIGVIGGSVPTITYSQVSSYTNPFVRFTGQDFILYYALPAECNEISGTQMLYRVTSGDRTRLIVSYLTTVSDTTTTLTDYDSFQYSTTFTSVEETAAVSEFRSDGETLYLTIQFDGNSGADYIDLVQVNYQSGRRVQ